MSRLRVFVVVPFMLMLMGITIYLDYMMLFVWWPGIHHHAVSPEDKLRVLFGLGALLAWNLGHLPIIFWALGKINDEGEG